MPKYLLSSFLLLLFACAASAQRRKAPATDFSSTPVYAPNKEMLRAGLRSFRQVDFVPGYGRSLDSSKLWEFRYDKSGRLIESMSFEYRSEPATRREPPFDKLQARFREGGRIAYEYDPAGNVIAMRDYALLQGGSEEALNVALIRRFSRESENFHDIDREALRDKARAFADSFMAGSHTDEWVLESETRYSYDSDGNLLTEEAPAEHKTTRYNYVYDQRGFVTLMRSVYKVAERGQNLSYYSGQEVHFSYTPDGKPATIRVYIGEHDTGKIAIDGYLRRRQEIRYTTSGDPDTTTYYETGSVVKHVVAYDKRLRKAYTILRTGANATMPDTVSHITYRYRDTTLSEAVTISFRDRKRVYEEREIYAYNDKGLPIENSEYRRELPSGDTKMLLRLFFYGNEQEDARTARRYVDESAKMAERNAKHDADIRESIRVREEEQRKRIAAMPKPIDVAPRLPVEKPIFKFVEQMPRFDGDMNAFISANLVYPPKAKKDSIEGRTVVEFVIREDGRVTDAKTVRAAGNGFDEAGIAMVQRMPKWIPGKQQGKAVSVYFTLPVTFRLPSSKAGGVTAPAHPATPKTPPSAGVEAGVLAPSGNDKLAVEFSAQEERYADGVVAMKGTWGYLDIGGRTQLRHWMDKKSRVSGDVHTDPSSYFPYAGVPRLVIDGTFRTWYPNGNRESVVEYRNGIQHGGYERWFYYGNREVEGHFEDGLATGVWKFYYPNGQLKMSAYYENIGSAKPARDLNSGSMTYDKDRALANAVTNGFSNPLSWLGQRNMPHGKVVVYGDGGDTAAVMHFAHGRRVGTWSRWGDGKKKVVAQYRNDTLIAVYDRRGHDVLKDDAYAVYFDYATLFYRDDSIDSTGAEPVFPANYHIRDRNFQKTTFPGGESELTGFLAKHLRMPAELEKVGKRGGVRIGFVVRPDGSRTDLRLESGIGYGGDEEALRLVKAMPKWEPARFQGRAVAMKTAVVVMFGR